MLKEKLPADYKGTIGTREADASLVEINSILFDLMNNWNFEGKWYHYLQVDIFPNRY